MRLPEFEHLEPESIKEACELLSMYKGKSKVIAGGTDLLNSMKQRLISPMYLIDIKPLPEMKGIIFDEKEGLKIGALTTHQELINSAVVKEKYPVLANAVSVIGSVQLQAMGTIGGNLCLNTRCWFYNQSLWWRKAREACYKLGGRVCHVVPESDKCLATYQADMAPSLIALNAKIKLVKQGNEKIIPLKDFYTGDGKSPLMLKEEEILTEIQVPVPVKGSGAHYEKLRLRDAIDFPLVGAAVNITLEDSGLCKEVKVIINALGPCPQEVVRGGEILNGREIKEELIQELEEAAFQEARPVETMPESIEYRKKMVKVMVKEAFQKALKTARG